MVFSDNYLYTSREQLFELRAKCPVGKFNGSYALPWGKCFFYFHKWRLKDQQFFGFEHIQILSVKASCHNF